MKTSQKIILGFAGIVFLIAAAEYISIYQSKLALQRAISNHSVERAREVISKIDRNIYHRIEQVQTYAKDLAQEDMLIKSNLDFDISNNTQELIKQRDEEWQAAAQETLTPLMQEIIDNELSDEIREEFELKGFYRSKYGYPVYAEVFITNKYGANVAQSQRTTDYYQADEEWWHGSKQNGFYISDVVYDESARIYSLDICSRVDDADGGFMGVLKVVFDTAEVIHILKEAERAATHKSAQFKLLTSDGKIIYSTEEHVSMKDSFDITPLFNKEKTHGYSISEGDKPGETTELFAYARSQGHKEFKGLGWILIVEHKTSEIFFPTTLLKRRLLFTSLGMLLLIISFGLFLSKRISDSIKKTV